MGKSSVLVNKWMGILREAYETCSTAAGEHISRPLRALSLNLRKREGREEASGGSD